MYRVIAIIFSIYLLANPFYIFKSGLPQPSDMLMALGLIGFILTGAISYVWKLKIFKSLLRFIMIVVLINTIYFFYYTGQGVENKFFMSNLFYIFNLLFFGLVIWALAKNKEHFINQVSLFIIISLTIQFFLGIAGIGGTGGMRNAIFFNNPNQLGYYVLLSLSLFTALPSKYRSNRVIALATIFISAYLILLSGSRAALIGVILISAILFIKEGVKLEFSSVIFVLISIIVAVYFLGNSSFVESKLASIEERDQRSVNKRVSFWEERAYDRFYLYPEKVLYGAGDGLFTRFKSYHQLEMHSGFGTVLFSYGFLGFILFAIFMRTVLSKALFMNLLLLTPVFLYNLSHQGFRDSLFWMLLASVYFVTETSTEDRKPKNLYST